MGIVSFYSDVFITWGGAYSHVMTLYNTSMFAPQIGSLHYSLLSALHFITLDPFIMSFPISQHCGLNTVISLSPSIVIQNDLVLCGLGLSNRSTLLMLDAALPLLVCGNLAEAGLASSTRINVSE